MGLCSDAAEIRREKGGCRGWMLLVTEIASQIDVLVVDLRILRDAEGKEGVAADTEEREKRESRRGEVSFAAAGCFRGGGELVYGDDHDTPSKSNGGLSVTHG